MATKPSTPAKKAPRLKPIRLQGPTIQLGANRLAELFYITYSTKALNDLLRARQIGIPKTKRDSAIRLATWATREGARFDLHLS